jgi:eukaryotic-like serine/threonine-protein kinase
MEFQLGETYHGYQFLDVLKRSRNGIEFRVQNTMVGRLEVLRALAERAQDDQEQSERFEREMRVHAGLLHPNIVTLFNAVELENHLVVTTELVEGPTLADKLLAGPLASAEAVALIRQVLSAVGYAHQHGIVHRDISPENIVIGSGGVAKLANFGWAKGASSPKLTQAGVALGNLKYTSPEQVKGMGDVDARSDLYSLGMVLYELLCGQPAFQLESQFELMMAHVSAPPAPPNSVKADVPEALAAVVLKALAKNPADRYQTAAEFDEALGQVSEAIVTLPEAAAVEIAGAKVEATLAAESVGVEAAVEATMTAAASVSAEAAPAGDVVVASAEAAMETDPAGESAGVETAVDITPTTTASVSAEAAAAAVVDNAEAAGEMPPTAAASVGADTAPADVVDSAEAAGEMAPAPAESVDADAGPAAVETTPAADVVVASAEAVTETAPAGESADVEAAGEMAPTAAASVGAEIAPAVAVESAEAAVEMPLAPAESVCAETELAAAVEAKPTGDVVVASAEAVTETAPAGESADVEAVDEMAPAAAASMSEEAAPAAVVDSTGAAGEIEPAPAGSVGTEAAAAAVETTPAGESGSAEAAAETRPAEVSVEAAELAGVESAESDTSLQASPAPSSEGAEAAVDLTPAAESVSVEAALTAAVETVHAALETVLAADSLDAKSASMTRASVETAWILDSVSGETAGAPPIAASADSIEHWQAPVESLPAPLVEWFPQAEPAAAKATADVVALSTSVETPAEATPMVIEIQPSAEPVPEDVPRDVPRERAAPIPVSAPAPTDMSALFAAVGNPPLSRVQLIVGSAAGACLGVLLVVLWIFVK